MPSFASGKIALVCLLVTMAGFASLASAAGREMVRFRIVEQKTVHLNDQKTAAAYHQSLTKLGVQSKVHSHGNHFDLTFHCPQWREANFKSHDEAHQWEHWLKSLGFETEHHH